MTVRAAEREDIDAIGGLAQATDLFPSEMLPEMIEPGLSGEDDIWLVAPDTGEPKAFAFARPEELTDRVWNLLAIGVHPDAQGKGLGRAMLAAVEGKLAASRMIIIETTQLPEQGAARSLYESAGYKAVATIPDFFEDGVDKLVFAKCVESQT